MYEVSYWVKAQAWMRPADLAVVGAGERWTYRELEERVSRLSQAIRLHLGVGQGDRVAILSANGPEYLLLFLAVARCGAILVPLNWRLSPTELAYQLQDSESRRIFSSAEYYALATELTDQLGLERPVLLSPESSVLLSPEPRAPREPDLLQIDGLMAAAPEADPDEEPLSWELPLLIGYTSGTTGKPKGAVLTHANFFWNALNDLLTIDLRSSDVTITLLPMFHIGGLGLFTLPTLLVGGRVVIPERFEPEEALQAIQEERVTVVMGVPTLHRRMLEAIDMIKPDLSSVRLFYSGGAPCPVDLIIAYHERGLTFGQGYGLTETSPTVFMQVAQADFLRKAGTVGRPAPFNRVRLVDPSTGAQVGPGVVGEVLVRGPNVFREYWRNEPATQEALRGGWFHTGDLARADEEGFVTISGRLKELIITGGENVYPIEVEQVIQAHPAVAEAAVFGVPDPEWGESPHAAVLLEPGAAITESELRAHCLAQIAKYKVPVRFHFMVDLPRNASGKVLKGELVRMAQSV